MQEFEAEVGTLMEDPDNPRQDFGDEAEELRLGNSLSKGQDYPILVMRHIKLTDCLVVSDGNRRLRAARRVGLKKLRAMMIDKKLTDVEIRLLQLRTDIHKKHLTAFERSMVAIGIAEANPGLTIKQLAELVEMEESLLWKYLQAKKLCPEAMQAYKDGTLALRAMVEVSKLPLEEQPAFMKAGGTCDEMRAARIRRNGQAAPAVRTARSRIPLATEAATGTVTVAGEAIDLEDAENILKEALRAVRAAKDKGLNAATAQRVWREVAAAS